MSLLLLIAAVGGMFGLGLAVAAWLVPPGSRPTPSGLHAERAGLALLLGIALTSWILFAWSLAGGRLGPAVSWTLTVLGWACLLIIGVRGLRGRRSASGASAPETITDSALARCCRWLVGCLFVVVLLQTLLTPQRFWDERAIFAIKPKALFLDGTIQSETLSHPEFVQGHPRYPLLLPLAEAHVYAVLGRIDDRWAKVIFPLLYFGLVLSVAGVLSRHFDSGRGWLYALLVATLPVLFPFELGVISGQGDAPVACFHGAAALLMWDALRRLRTESALTVTPRHWGMTGLLAASAAFAKDEGIAFLIVDAIALTAAWAWGRRRAAWSSDVPCAPASLFGLRSWFRCGLCLGGVAAVLLVPWFVHRRGLPTVTEMQYFDRLSFRLLVERLDALGWLVPHLARRMFLEWRDWGLQWWLLLAALVTMPRRAFAAEQLFLLLNIAGGVAALVVAGMIAPADLHDHIGGSSHRYLMQLAPLAILFAAGQWAESSRATP